MITVLLSLINIGAAAALNALVALYIVATLSSYAVTIAVLVHRRLTGEPLPVRRWTLGRYGLAINIVALLFIAVIWFFAFWPVATPTNKEDMNYAIVIYSVVLGFAGIYYVVHGRHVYTSPNRRILLEE